jgi:hypothetical protein
MKTVLWIPARDQYQRIAQQHPEIVARSNLCTVDAALCWLWQQENVAHTSLWQFITLEDQLEAAEEALCLSDSWLKDEPILRYRDSHLGELCHTSLLYTFRDALLAGRIASRFLDQASPTRLILPRSAGTDKAGAKVMEAVLQWTARRRGCHVENPEISALPVPSGHLHFFGRTFRDIQASISNRILLPDRSQRSQAKRPTVMFFGGGTDFVNQVQLVTRLRATRPYRVLHVNLSPKLPPTSAYSRSQTLVHQPFLRLRAYGSLSQQLRLHTVGQRAWQWFRSCRPAYKARYPELFDNASLEGVFQRFFLDTLPRAGGALEAAGQLMDASTPNVVVLNNDAGARERAIVQAARNRQIPSVLMIHAGVNDLHFRRASADQVWVWGERHRQQLTAIGLPPDRIRVTGNPNYDYLVDFKSAAGAARTRVRRQLGIAEDTLLLLLISAKSPNLLTFVDVEQHLRDLRAVCQAFDGQPKAQLVIKPHPRYDDVTIYRQMAARHGQVMVVDDIMLDQLLAACDAALMVNFASTGGMEALLLGKPVVWINASARPPVSYSVFEQGALTVSKHLQIGPALGQFLSSPKMRQSITDLGQQLLPTLVAHRDGSATEVVLLEIDRMVQRGGIER